MDTVLLIGTEEVTRAANRIASAAEQMQRAASQMDEALSLHTQRMDELVTRLETLKPPRGSAHNGKS